MSQLFTLVPGKLTPQDIQYCLTQKHRLELADTAWEAIHASNAFLQTIVDSGEIVYGINTGFGLLAHTKIAPHELEDLQYRILVSHAAGVGELLPDNISQLALLLKINSLARGYSGVRPVIIETLMQFYNHGIVPCIPAKGSVGASGDLAPLAHLSLLLIGEGTAHYQGNTIHGREALALIKKQPLKLGPKEGLALINGTQISTAIALAHTLEAHSLLKAAIVIGAMSVDAALGNITPFHPLIHQVRGQPGQIKVAARLHQFLSDSPILTTSHTARRLQDPYSLRCQPQVLGACLDNLRHALEVLIIEANGVTDNPLIFAQESLVMSGGNFHAEPVAQVADLVAISLSEIGSFVERQIALLVDPHFNGGLPAFLVPNPGLNSGFMIAHVTAAALASANKALSHPFSVDSIPTSANQEDHVSMATYAAWRLKEILANVQGVLAVGLLAAAQGIELRRPLQSSPKLEAIIQQLRLHVDFYSEDRYFSPDIEKAQAFILQLGRQEESLIF